MTASAALVNFSRAANAPTPNTTAATPNVSIDYNASTQTYTLSGITTPGTTQVVTASYGPAQLQSGTTGSYYATTSANGVTNVSTLQVHQVTTLTYSDIGTWKTGATQADGSQNFNTVYFSYGIRTQASDMPKTGTASYNLSLLGETAGGIGGGNGTLNADFGSGAVAISLSPTTVYPNGTSTLGPFTASGTISSGNSAFSAAITNPSYTGSVNGVFYGPQAVEAGGSYAINSASSGAFVAAGAFSGKRN